MIRFYCKDEKNWGPSYYGLDYKTMKINAGLKANEKAAVLSGLCMI